MSLSQQIVKIARQKIGCPYVYGTWGQLCTTALRKRYSNYNPSQKDITYKRCPVLSGKQSTCDGCKYKGKLAFDCRGFTHWCLQQVGIKITGDYVGRQWTDKNWDLTGTIENMPNLVCCLFIYQGGKWKHTGLHIGNKHVIHCSVEVKEQILNEGGRKWTHWAIPKGLYTKEEIDKALKEVDVKMETIRKGSQGIAVTKLQTLLTDLGYKIGTIDGIFGAKTEVALKDYQSKNGLKADGICGPATWKKLIPDEKKEETPQQDKKEEEADSNMIEISAAELQHVINLLQEAEKIINSWYEK